MKIKLPFLLLMLASAAFAYEAAIQYFARLRAVTVPEAAAQSYVTVDADLWHYARPDLGDLRLYDGQTQVPYALIKESGGDSGEEVPVRMLNLGSVAGQTEFDLDVSSLAEYDRVRLDLAAKNFINNTRVQGRRSLNEGSGIDLGASTLYDFRNEGLGSNSSLKFAMASFPYLHVRLGPGIRPDQVKGAYLANFVETKASWSNAGQCSPVAASGKQTMFDCATNTGMPVERIGFQVQGLNGTGNQANFSRTVLVSDNKGTEIQSDTISRVQVKRAGQTVSNEKLTIDMYPHAEGSVRIAVENGDDSPLPITQVQPLAFERRIYFDPRGHAALRLYYGDPKLGAPTYDYARFFQQAPDAIAAQLAPAEANAQFIGRPDDRPWSERHNWILWAAMVFAVAVLGVLTIRGLKSEGENP